jgi:hypothetical protein
MTKHRGIHRPRRRQRIGPLVVLAVTALLVVSSATGVYVAYSTGHITRQSTGTALAAHSAHVSRHSARQNKSRYGHIKSKPGRTGTNPALTPTNSGTAPKTSPTPTPTPTPSVTSTSTPVGSTTAPVTTANCSGALNTPGGPDPWGGCWPGPGNTGVPAGVSLTPYSGSCTISVPNTVIDAKLVNCALDIEAPGVTIQDSNIIGQVHNNSSGALLIKSTEINGGNDQSETVGGDDITILGSNLYGDQHEFHCGSNCTVENSWLHDNYNFGPSGHQNGFLSNGGSNFVIRHNSVYCVGGCTGDISFIPDDDINNATVDKNLLVATQYAAFCLYPSSDHPAKPGIVSGMVVTDNVFQRGANGKCAYYGPVYGWDTSNQPSADGYGNVWSGNMWDDGQSLGSP